MVSWDTVGGIQALGCPQGPPQTGFGVAQYGPVEVLALFVKAELAGERLKFYHLDFAGPRVPWGTQGRVP